jgi:competence protein ComEC
MVSQALAADAFAEDCSRAAIVVTDRDGPPACAAMIIDRKLTRAQGAIALRHDGAGFVQTAARPAGEDRPWARATAAPEESVTPRARVQPRDATPRAEDLEAGD